MAEIYLRFALTAEERKKKIDELIKDGPERGLLGLTLYGERESKYTDPKWQYDLDTPQQIDTLIQDLDKRIEEAYQQRPGYYCGATVTVFDHPRAYAGYR